MTTEVRRSPDSGQLGLFAVQDFNSGDIILEEIPLVKLAPSDEKSYDELVSTLWDSIEPPSDGSVPDYLHGTFKGMVKTGIIAIRGMHQEAIDQNKIESILQLYHPTKESTSDTEKPIVKVADEAINFIREHISTSKTTEQMFSEFENWDILLKICLVWCCNSFQGGRIYQQLSRVNHSCNPNAVIQTTKVTQQANQEHKNDDSNNDGQQLVAATNIQKGSEIYISYLGLILYTDTVVRKKKLERTKFFNCLCSRCCAASSEGDEGAAKIPCPVFHPRDPQQMSLDEDAQYDDDQSVRYISLMEPKSNDKSGTDNEKLYKVLRSVCGIIESLLETYDDDGLAKTTSVNNEDEDEKDDILEQHVGLSSTMMGDKHWTSNLTLLLHLDRRLSAMSKRMIVTQELPGEEEIAEAIDSLDRISRFVDSLKLDIDPGHVLGDVIIGTARMLISLGDEKSQKYGAEWLSKIDDYVEQFANDGVKKVVKTLKVAWTKQDRSNDEEGDSNKKAKLI
ncbi:MAG: hypothetical protein ACI8RD_006787 [Bacillariaceae sp.]|jgi:hypothetical protein